VSVIEGLKSRSAAPFAFHDCPIRLGRLILGDQRPGFLARWLSVTQSGRVRQKQCRIAHERSLSEDLCSSFAGGNTPETLLSSPARPGKGWLRRLLDPTALMGSVGQGDEQGHGTNVPDKPHLKAIPEWLAAA
jgi:hypothetical protein